MYIIHKIRTLDNELSRWWINISFYVSIINRFSSIGYNKFTFPIHLPNKHLSFSWFILHNSSNMSCICPSPSILVDNQRTISWRLTNSKSCISCIIIPCIRITTKRPVLSCFTDIWEYFRRYDSRISSTVTSIESV